MATTGAAPYSLPAPQLEDGADIEEAVVPLRDRLQEVLPAQVPVGALMMWLTDIAPLWWLVCNGQDVDATQYPRLASVIAPVGGRIILPDLRSRLPLGASASRPLGSQGGVETVKLSALEIPSHSHGDGTLAAADAGAHGHYVDGINAGGMPPTLDGRRIGGSQFIGAGGSSYTIAVSGGGSYSWTMEARAVGNHTHDVNGSTAPVGSDQSHENMPPYLAVNYIIRAE